MRARTSIKLWTMQLKSHKKGRVDVTICTHEEKMVDLRRIATCIFQKIFSELVYYWGKVSNRGLNGNQPYSLHEYRFSRPHDQKQRKTRSRIPDRSLSTNLGVESDQSPFIQVDQCESHDPTPVL